MWHDDKSAEAAGRLENLKELVRSMEEFPDLAAFLEHVSLVMETDEARRQRVSIMTLHGAKGLEFETVFLPGWEEGLFPHQRSLDESGRAGLEEERRLAYVGVTRAKRRVEILFATNRRIHGLWQTTVPSRFIDDLPAVHVEVVEAASASQYGAYGNRASPIWTSTARAIRTPGWKRAQQRAEPRRARSARESRRARARQPMTIEGEVIARSSGGARLRRRRAGVSPEVRPRHGGGGRRQQAHRRFRQGRPQDGAGEFRASGVSSLQSVIRLLYPQFRFVSSRPPIGCCSVPCCPAVTVPFFRHKAPPRRPRRFTTSAARDTLQRALADCRAAALRPYLLHRNWPQTSPRRGLAGG